MLALSLFCTTVFAVGFVSRTPPERESAGPGADTAGIAFSVSAMSHHPSGPVNVGAVMEPGSHEKVGRRISSPGQSADAHLPGSVTATSHGLYDRTSDDSTRVESIEAADGATAKDELRLRGVQPQDAQRLSGVRRGVSQPSRGVGSQLQGLAAARGLYRGRTASYWAERFRHRTRQLQAALGRIKQLKQQLRRRHTSAATSTPTSSYGVWDSLADCESSGNWADTDGSFEGGLQFLNSTWLAHGGGAYAAHAYSASRDQQIAVAERVLAAAGGRFTDWPGCRAKLGLP